MSEDRRVRLQTLLSSGGAFPVVKKSLIRVSGSDCVRYLNGQLTIDVLKLSTGRARSALLLTAKGKLCAPIWIWKDNDSLLLEVDECLLQETLDRLEKYIISDDVTLTVLSPSSQVFHVFGTDTAPDDCLKIPRLGVEGFDTGHVPDAMLTANPGEVEFLRITRALPRWGLELDSSILPQEAGLDVTSVDFDKGCYVGQEVVSRLKSVGRVNRRLQAFAGQLDRTSREPLSLLLPDQPGKVAGVITSRCEDLELAQTIALGYLNREFEDSSSFVVADADGNALGNFDKRTILT